MRKWCKFLQPISTNVHYFAIHSINKELNRIELMQNQSTCKYVGHSNKNVLTLEIFYRDCVVVENVHTP